MTSVYQTFSRAILPLTILLTTNSCMADEERRPHWLIGNGDRMQVRLTCEVLNADGTPATEFEAQPVLKTQHSSQPLKPHVDANHVTFEVPVGGAYWRHVVLSIGSTATAARVTRTIAFYELRDLAEKGLRLKLKPPERVISVAVRHNGRPVSDAYLVAGLTVGEVRARTDAAGVATLNVMREDRLFSLAAWTDDFRVGGFTFHRDPPRDPAGSSFVVELEPCRRQKIRAVDSSNGNPIPDLDFTLVVGTGPPDYQFLMGIPDCTLTTDASGETECKWFPDWESQGAYATLSNPRWVPERNSRVEDGTVTDEHGRFEAGYLPGATYCIFVNDTRFVSNLVTKIPWHAEAARTDAPTLTVTEGRPIEVILTAGEDRKLVPYQAINLRTNHDYSWMENGQSKQGRGSRRWHGTTNRFGRFFTSALSGEIEVSIYTPEWRTQKTVAVREEGITRVRLHRLYDKPRTLKGRLTAPDGISVADATVVIGSVDGETNERHVLKADANGSFQFQTKAALLGLVAHTPDGRFAACRIFDGTEEPLEFNLLKAPPINGRLLNGQEEPLKRQPMEVVIAVRGLEGFDHAYAPVLRHSFPAVTDDNGRFEFRGVPTRQIDDQRLWFHQLDRNDSNRRETIGTFRELDREASLILRSSE